MYRLYQTVQSVKFITGLVIVTLAVTAAYLLLPIGKSWDEVTNSYNATRTRDPNMVQAVQRQSREDFLKDVGRYGIDPNAKTIYIGVGHSATEKGAFYDHGTGKGSFDETELNLIYAMATKEALEAAGFKVVISRTEPNGPSLEERIKQTITVQPVATIEMHFNSFTGDLTANGTETYYHYGRASADQPFAEKIQNAIITNAGTFNRGVKPDSSGQYESFGICRRPNVTEDGMGSYEWPRLLVEIEFITNYDAMTSLQKKGPNVVGKAIADACLQYFAY